MVNRSSITIAVSMIVSFTAQAVGQPEPNAQQRVEASLQDEPFYQQVLKAPAIIPANMTQASVNCPLTSHQDMHSQYKSARQSQSDQYGWEQRISADWRFF